MICLLLLETFTIIYLSVSVNLLCQIHQNGVPSSNLVFDQQHQQLMSPRIVGPTFTPAQITQMIQRSVGSTIVGTADLQQLSANPIAGADKGVIDLTDEEDRMTSQTSLLQSILPQPTSLAAIRPAGMVLSAAAGSNTTYLLYTPAPPVVITRPQQIMSKPAVLVPNVALASSAPATDTFRPAMMNNRLAPIMARQLNIAPQMMRPPPPLQSAPPQRAIQSNSSQQDVRNKTFVSSLTRFRSRWPFP